jgi:hypothetical protein
MQKKTLCQMCIVSAMMVMFSTSCLADDVYTKEGRRLIGSIIEESEASLTLKNEEGTFIINQSDVLHIERSAEPESPSTGLSPKNIIDDLKQTYRKLSHNNWHFVRSKIRRAHAKLFFALNKNKLYRLITDIDGIQRFRQENYKSFVFAVYMILLLMVGMVFGFIQKLIYSIYCKFRGIKPRYDT